MMQLEICDYILRHPNVNHSLVALRINFIILWLYIFFLGTLRKDFLR